MESGTKLYSVNVQGFSKEFTEERIKDLLSKFGEVVECRFVGPSLKAPHHEKTRAIVKFTSKMEAATAIARLDKQPPFFLSVDWTGSQPENEPCKKLDGRGDRGRLSVLYGRGSVGPKRYRGRSMDSNNTRDPGHPLYVPAAKPEPCANCFQEGRLRCSRCKTWYCTVVCQENHWTKHRDRCFAPPPLENPDGSLYEVELDVSNIKIVRNNDSESSSDEVISLKKLSKMGRSGPLNSTLKEDHETLVADKTVIEMVEKSPAVESTLVPSEKVTNITAKDKYHGKIVEEEIRDKLSDSVVSNVDSSFKSRVKPVSYENNNVLELTTESSSNAANKSKIKALSPQIETPTTVLSKKSEKVSKCIKTETVFLKSPHATDSSLLVGKPIHVSVSHVFSPSDFYVVPETSQEVFEAILLDIQDQPNIAAEIFQGEKCLAMHEDLWYRGMISQVAPDGASARVVLIDFGNDERIPVSEIKADSSQWDEHGVARRVGLAAIAPARDSWTTQEIETFKGIVDEGGETKFSATVIGYNGKGQTIVNLVDGDKNDVGELCVDPRVGVGIKVIHTFANMFPFEAEKEETLETEVEDEKKKIVKIEEVVTTIESKVNAKEKSDSSLKFGNPTEVMVVYCSSPRNMSVLPSSKSDQWNDLVANTQNPLPGGVEPKVGQLYLTEHEGIWARALVQKISPDKTQVKVDLIDFGNVGLKIKTTELRKLTKYIEVEGLVERVGLAGLGVKGEKWEEPELELFKQVVEIGGETKFVVESLGVLDGIDMVTMKDMEGNDIKELCVTIEIGIILEDVFTPVSKNYLPEEKDKKGKPDDVVISEKLASPNPQLKLNKSKDIHETTKLEEKSVSLKQTQVENVNIPEINNKNQQIIGEKEKATSSLVIETGKFPRQSIGTVRPEEVSVRFAESPSKFYLLQTSQSSVFNEVIQSCQAMPAVDKVNPEPGLVCLAKFEDSWHRAEVGKVSPDGCRVQLFLIDYGKIINVGRGQLKALGKFDQVPGLVCEVGLAGIKAAQGQWSKEDIENFNLVIDAGGETKFMAKAVGLDEDGVVRVEMSDLEENDITELCLMMGVGVTCNASLMEIDTPVSHENNIVEKERRHDDIDPPQKKAAQALKCFPRIELPVNIPTEVNVTHADNPDKIYVFPSKANEKFMEVLVGCQEPPGGIVDPTVGLVCLAFADEIWHRAEIKKIFHGKETVQIYLVDDGKTIEVSVDVLRHLNKFTDVPGHVAEVGLINLGCGEEMWSQEALDLMVTILDVGKDTTFALTNLGKDEDGVDRVKMIDTAGNDISHFCVEMKVGVTVEHKLKPSELKDTVSKSQSPRIKPKAPIKPAAPLRTTLSETAAPLKTVLSTTAIPQITTSPDKNGTAVNSIPKASNEGAPSQFWRPPCADSVLTTLIRGNKFKVMKETKLSLRYFSSICLPEDNSTTNYLLDDLQSEAAVCRVSGDASASFDVRSWVVAWSLSDQMYYRAVIVGVVPPDTYTAFLIDFAMTQQFKKADLLEMWSDATRHKAMAIQLTAIGRISPEVENQCNAHFDANATVDCEVTEVNNNHITVLIPEMGVKFTALPWYHCDNAVRTLFQTEAPAAKAAEDEQLEADQKIMMKDLKTSRLVEGAKVRYCGHGDKICDVYVKQETDEESVTSLMATLNVALCSRDRREYTEPVVGSIVAAKWSQDEQKMFYRASVTAINSKEKKAKLLLVDYGTRIVEDWANITWLPQEVRKAPMYAVPVVLANVLSSSIRFRSELLDDIARDYSSESLTLKIVSHTAPPVVKLFINKTKTLNDALHFSEDGAEAEVLSEKEKKKLEIAQKMALLEAEYANI